MKYLMLIKHAENTDVREVPQALMDAMGTLVTEGLTSGAILDTAGLKPTKDGFRVRLDGGRLLATDGPFTETKEVIGGYALMQFATREQAFEAARGFMDLHRIHWPAFVGECEVRPLEDM